MDTAAEKHFKKVLHHLYINPLEKCNLKCKMCYTKKTSPILSEEEILDFVFRYQKAYELKMITFCGGEVFALPYFPHLLNSLTAQGIFIQTITNGTIDCLEEIAQPNLHNLIVSLDGLEEYHDKNRGIDTFQKSLAFLKKAQSLGFHIEIFSIVTKQNYADIESFENYLKKELTNIEATYHPRKPPAYLLHHPISNIEGTVDGFDYLPSDQLIELMKKRKVFPPKELGCYQIALASSGLVYGCCEGFLPLGKIDDDMRVLFSSLKKRIVGPCLGCSQAGFMCGIKDIINQLNK